MVAIEIPEQTHKSLYPQPFAMLMEGRVKRKLGDYFGLQNFGVNLTELAPGSVSALKHQHARQDEFIYVVSGSPTLLVGEDEFTMQPGECFGFRAGSSEAHQLINRSNETVIYLEVGDRTPGDGVVYPDDDLCALSSEDGSWHFLHKDGKPY